MRIWAASIAVVAMGSGCNYGPYEFVCGQRSCGQSGTCEANRFCSFPDSTCPSGRRFGELSGPSAGQCVSSELLPDAGPGAPADARVCFGTAPFTFCFAAPPAGAIDVSMPTTFDTVNGTVAGTQLNCATPMSGGNGYCVIAADTIKIGARLRAIGMKPLVLVAATSIDVPVAGSIDVGSHRQPESLGAGADPATGCNAGNSPGSANGTSGGGAGGSFQGAGGNGGNGGNGGGNGGSRGSAIASVTTLRGGCPGQDGAGVMKGLRGHGGGAVFLIAGNTITVGGGISAGGEGGGGGAGQDSGGGGGGGGGMIGFDAATIMFGGSLIANGGGGAEGGGSSSNGNPGSDAMSTIAAAGGSGGTTFAGDGGDGSAGIVAGPGKAGTDGNATSGGGGGGGGGGAGLIKGPPSSLSGSVSPPATP